VSIFISVTLFRRLSLVTLDLAVLFLTEVSSKYAGPASPLLKNVRSEAKTRQKREINRSLHGVNEDFEPIFNAVFASVVVSQQPAKLS